MRSIPRLFLSGVCFWMVVTPAMGQTQQADAPQAQNAGSLFNDCDHCPEMVVMPSGNLALGAHEVTLGQYRAFVEATKHPIGGCIADGDDWLTPGFAQTNEHPVTCVNWNDAQEYVRWLSAETGQEYSLPTEEDWANAAVGTSEGCGLDPDQSGTCPAPYSEPNDVGLRDMVGNVWEWTSDCWEGNCDAHIARGSAWTESPTTLSPNARSAIPAGYRHFGLGFRVARVVDNKLQ